LYCVVPERQDVGIFLPGSVYVTIEADVVVLWVDVLVAAEIFGVIAGVHLEPVI
jgi:hypothetical protein